MLFMLLGWLHIVLRLVILKDNLELSDWNVIIKLDQYFVEQWQYGDNWWRTQWTLICIKTDHWFHLLVQTHNDTPNSICYLVPFYLFLLLLLCFTIKIYKQNFSHTFINNIRCFWTNHNSKYTVCFTPVLMYITEVKNF